MGQVCSNLAGRPVEDAMSQHEAPPPRRYTKENLAGMSATLLDDAANEEARSVLLEHAQDLAPEDQKVLRRSLALGTPPPPAAVDPEPTKQASSFFQEVVVPPHMMMAMTLWAATKFMKEWGPKDPQKCDGYTFLTEHVKPWIEERDVQNSVCELIAPMWEGSVGTPNVFVSHAQTEPLGMTMSVLERYLRAQTLSLELWFCWLDYFNIKQHQKDFHPKVVKEVINRIAHTVMIAHPWDKPATIQRVWCIFEILSTVIGGAVFKVALPEMGEKAFVGSFMADGGAKQVETALSYIDVRNARAYRPEDQKTIIDLIECTVGDTKTNSSVVLALKGAYLTIAEEEAVRNPEHIRTLNQVGVLIKTLTNDGRRRLPYAIKALELVEKRDGPKSESVATRCENVASTYNIMKEYEKALEVYTRCLSIRMELLGPKDRFVGITNKDLGETYMHLGQLDEAAQHLLLAIQVFEGHGNQPLNTAWTMLILGRTLQKQKRFDEARASFESALSTREKKLHKEHPLVADVCNYFGSFLAEDGTKSDFPRAKELLERAIHVYTVAFGEHFEKTVEAKAHYDALMAKETP